MKEKKSKGIESKKSLRNTMPKQASENNNNILLRQIQEALEKIRPSLQADGGDVELVEYRKGIVKVRLRGVCCGCPMSEMTLKMSIEEALKKKISEIKSVESVI